MYMFVWCLSFRPDISLAQVLNVKLITPLLFLILLFLT